MSVFPRLSAKQSNRTCEQCGGAMPNRMSRQRNDKGHLVCDSCKGNPMPNWNTTHSALSIVDQSEMRRREAEAIRAISRVRQAKHLQRMAAAGCEYTDDSGRCGKPVEYHVLEPGADGDAVFVCEGHLGAAKGEMSRGGRKTPIVKKTGSLRSLAHDSGDNAIINHCPFCGSGAVVAGSDGSVSCDFCHTPFTVQVQPTHPFMPQTIDGQPVNPPGMPGGEETEMSAPADPAVNEEEDGVSEDPLGDAQPTVPSNGPVRPGQPPTKQPPEGGAEKKPGGGGKPPWLKSKSSANESIDRALAEKAKTMTVREFIAHQHSGSKGCTCPPSYKRCRWAEFWERAQAGHYDEKTPRQSFRTATGQTLDADAYMARLALEHADDRAAVLDAVRAGNLMRQATDQWNHTEGGEDLYPGDLLNREPIVEDLLNPQRPGYYSTDLLADNGLTPGPDWYVEPRPHQVDEHGHPHSGSVVPPFSREAGANEPLRSEASGTTTIYRGVYIELDPEDYDGMPGTLTQRVLKGGTDHTYGTPRVNLGQHWTTDRRVAQHFATPMTRTGETPTLGTDGWAVFVPVIVTAKVSSDDVVTDQASLEEAMVEGVGWIGIPSDTRLPEKEVLVRAGASVEVVDIEALSPRSWKTVARHHENFEAAKVLNLKAEWKSIGGGMRAVAAKDLVKHQVLAEDIQVGDRLDIMGRTRVSKVHPRGDQVMAQTQTTGTRSPSIRKWDRGETVTVWRKP